MKIKKLINKISNFVYLSIKKINIKLNNAYYKTVFNGLEKNMIIFGKIECVAPENIVFGNNCSLNEGAFFHGYGGIKIGNNVTISTGAKIISTQYDTKNWIQSCNQEIAVKSHISKEIFIGDHAWICANAVVLPGVRINGKGVIVSAGSVVTKSIDEDYVVVAGSPAKIVKRFKPEEYENLTSA